MTDHSCHAECVTCEQIRRIDTERIAAKVSALSRAERLTLLALAKGQLYGHGRGRWTHDQPTRDGPFPRFRFDESHPDKQGDGYYGTPTVTRLDRRGYCSVLGTSRQGTATITDIGRNVALLIGRKSARLTEPNDADPG